jgi:divalent metal cation (Fe/Co/Zn/Cd) transporter
VLGIFAAALGLWASHAFQRPELDGVASIVIGLLLCAVASLLIVQSRKLLVGVAVDGEMAHEIRRIASDEGGVIRAAWPLTMHLGPDDVLLALDAEFDPKLPAEAVQQSVNRVERAIRERFPEVKRIYIEARRVVDVPAGESIDRSTAQAEAHVQQPDADAEPPATDAPASRNVRSA